MYKDELNILILSIKNLGKQVIQLVIQNFNVSINYRFCNMIFCERGASVYAIMKKLAYRELILCSKRH